MTLLELDRSISLLEEMEFSIPCERAGTYCPEESHEAVWISNWSCHCVHFVCEDYRKGVLDAAARQPIYCDVHDKNHVKPIDFLPIGAK